MNKNNIPSISVIMGIYNSPIKEELTESIESIINQTFTSWEFIICDDCSTDDTWNFLNEKYGDNEKIILLKNEVNGGLRVALNKCLKYTRSEYIVRQDGDDISRKDRLSILWKYMKEHPKTDVLGTAMVSFDEKGTFGIIHPRKLNPTKNDFLRGSVVAHASTIMKKKAVEDLGGYRVSWETRRCEDYDLFMRMFAAGKKIENIDEPLYYVRQDRNTYARKKYSNRIKEAIVRFKGFRVLNMPFYTYVFVTKPLIIGLIPKQLQKKIKRMFHH